MPRDERDRQRGTNDRKLREPVTSDTVIVTRPETPRSRHLYTVSGDQTRPVKNAGLHAWSGNRLEGRADRQ